jgi:preprotein translocase subunit SecD
LTDGLLAGGIGLILVVIYSLIYYRALGIVTIASLLVSGGLTYASLVILGHEIGFTLTLAGIAGFIVAVGITADSFVVFFERIKDEVHEGRSMRVAVPRAWIRARRTILSADTVSFLAAATLYYFAAGDVRGFAFTLGLSTILDLVVVFLFTHPMLSLLSRSTAFGSARFSGLDAVREGGVAAAAETGTWRPRVRPAQRAATRNANREQAKPSATSVALLDGTDADDESSDEAGDGGTNLLGSVTDVGPGAPTDAGAGIDAGADDQGAEGATPGDGATVQPTTAAERAAARRARMRAKSDESRS